ncbi:MAG: Mg2 transporter protein CorA family protein [Parcubacteria group bacterium GW2011_GWA2_47_8b]|uniref:Mg2 transporter protein CorA family protein n=1 Tax=Candidatus Giovannonibacteria bacterium GW2011_GWB1_47_6b TaxID=1618655 RepID=A0A0G1T5H3_9BACT|nr:MAG: Mg2 transporter protein CorA family protein [Candidatus Giovannonibacteria bacterium GW2011_GWB1_47_6b]KKU84750.1 MAG: Mg2 transporter protein CorA family protein [Parcubacteria group bacterium GW2011_GWA2_47_8b]KKU85588.1 MAG: Mg2 transporter protein CorA family protein [Parcubacteria group bacterium GW2011_GWA1_47_9]
MWITRAQKVAWIDILKPTKADIDFVKKQHKFHPIILDELLHLSSRSRVDFYANYLFLTYHLPIYDKSLKTSRRAEIDFLITKDKVITIHYEDLEPLDTFMRSISNNINFKSQALQDSAHCTYFLIQEIIHFSMRQLRHIEDNIRNISQEIFKGKETQLLEKISYAKRDVLDFSIISAPQEILLSSLIETGTKFWGEETKIYLNDLAGDYSKVTQHVENYRATIEALETTNGQLLSAKTNNVMQRFTILAFLTFPMLFFTQLASIDFIGKFVAATPLRFWTLTALMGVIVVSLIITFRRKGWL